jgi:hypothetical protein
MARTDPRPGPFCAISRDPAGAHLISEVAGRFREALS